MRTRKKKKKIFKRSDVVRKFNSREEAIEFMTKEVFVREHFQEHVTQTANNLNISYVVAYHIITNHLIDIVYEIDLNIKNPQKNVMVRIYGYCSLRIGYLLNKKKSIKQNNATNKKTKQ